MIPRLKAALGFSEFKAAFTFSRSDDVNKFENEFARLADQKYAVAFPYGRTSLVFILNALGLENAEVICPAYTCVVVAHAIVTSGNVPVFVDSDKVDLNMDLRLIEKAITPNTKAIIATSIFGYPVNLNLLNEIRQRYPDLIIIQDCAHSFFCNWNERAVHKEGLCAFYGLNVSKIMTSIFGGMVTTDDKSFANKLREARNEILLPASVAKSLKRLLYFIMVYPIFTRIGYKFINRLERGGLIDSFVKHHKPDIIDMPSDYLQGMTSVEARVGEAQCKHYYSIVEHRHKIAMIYLEGFNDIQSLELPLYNDGATWSHFVIRTKYAKALIDIAFKAGIQLGEIIEYHIPSLLAYRSYRSVGEEYAKTLPGNVINLPVHAGVKEEDAFRIIKIIREKIQCLVK